MNSICFLLLLWVEVNKSVVGRTFAFSLMFFFLFHCSWISLLPQIVLHGLIVVKLTSEFQVEKHVFVIFHSGDSKWQNSENMWSFWCKSLPIYWWLGQTILDDHRGNRVCYCILFPFIISFLPFSLPLLSGW